MDNSQLYTSRVYKSNSLVEASYRLTVNEQRIILACISKVRRDQPLTDAVMYRVTVQDIAKLAGYTNNAAYAELSEAVGRLRKREVRIALDPNSNRRRPKELVTAWIQSVIYNEEEGHIDLRFAKDMLPYLAELTAQFTHYALSDVVRLTSGHAIRLFELLIQYRDFQRREISLEDLREWFELVDQYPLVADLRRWVIEPAVAQINEHTPWAVKWVARKTGRRITHFDFTFREKKAKAPKAGSLSESELAKLARPGETWEQVRARASRKAGQT